MAFDPAAWKPDPSKRFRMRWWNGQRWTEWVSDDSGTTTIDRISDAQALLYVAREKLSRVKGVRKGANRLETVEDGSNIDQSQWRAPSAESAQDPSEKKHAGSTHSSDRSTATTYEQCDALFPRPRIPKDKIASLVNQGSLKAIIDSPPAGWSKSRQPPKHITFPAPKFSQPDNVRTVSQLEAQLKTWKQERSLHHRHHRSEIFEWEREAQAWEEIVIELWRQALVADAVLIAIPNPSKALLGQHSRIVGRLNKVSLPKQSVREALQGAADALPTLNANGIESVLRDATKRLNNSQTLLKLNTAMLTKAEQAIAAIDEEISQKKSAASEQEFSPPESSGRKLERSASWQQWIYGVRKYLESFGPEGPPPQLSPASLEQLEQHVHGVLNSFWSEFETLDIELNSATIGEVLKVFPYLESFVADPQHAIRSEVVGIFDRCQEQLTEIEKVESELNKVRTLFERETKRFRSELETLKKQGKTKKNTYLDRTDNPWEIHNLLQIQSSNRFDQHHERVQDAALRYEARLQAGRAKRAKEEKAKEAAARKELANTRRRATNAQKELASTQEELKAAESSSRSRDSAIKTIEKKLRRLKEDLRDAQHEPPARRQRIEKNIARAQEDFDELKDAQNRVSSLRSKVSSLESEILEAKATIQAAESASTTTKSKSGTKRGAEPLIGFVKDSHDFEQFLARWMQWAGWPDAKAVPVGPDGGVDVKAKGALGQAKYWDKPVGIEEVQRHMGVAYKLKPTGRIFLSKNGYTPQAIEFAEREGMVLLEMKSERGSAKAVGVTSLAKVLIKGQ